MPTYTQNGSRSSRCQPPSHVFLPHALQGLHSIESEDSRFSKAVISSVKVVADKKARRLESLSTKHAVHRPSTKLNESLLSFLGAPSSHADWERYSQVAGYFSENLGSAAGTPGPPPAALTIRFVNISHDSNLRIAGRGA